MDVCYEFIGGALDGKKVSGASSEPRDAKLARFLTVATQGGLAGRWFRGMSGELLSPHEQTRFADRELPKLEFEVLGALEDGSRTVVQIRQRPG